MAIIYLRNNILVFWNVCGTEFNAYRWSIVVKKDAAGRQYILYFAHICLMYVFINIFYFINLKWPGRELICKYIIDWNHRGLRSNKVLNRSWKSPSKYLFLIFNVLLFYLELIRIFFHFRTCCFFFNISKLEIEKNMFENLS